MNHQDHLDLLRDGFIEGVWAEFGSGTGAFTLALAELAGPHSTLYSIDKDRNALRQQEIKLRSAFPELEVHYIAADLTQPLDLPPLDGIVMANVLHFFRHKEPVVQRLKGYLRLSGRFILIEYNVDRGNIWVPHPISYPAWEDLAQRCGFQNTRLLAKVPSSFLREFYSALSL